MARKWNVDYAFYKAGPDKYLLFFKSGQADAITACFSEYSKKVLNKSKSRRTPIREQLKQGADQLDKDKAHRRGEEAQRSERISGEKCPKEQSEVCADERRRRMKTDKIRKFLIPNIPYLFIGWAILKISTAYRMAAGADFLTKIMGIGQAFADLAPGLNPVDWLVGIVGAVGFRLLICMKSKKAKKFRRDEEYGSARWGNEKDIKPLHGMQWLR